MNRPPKVVRSRQQAPHHRSMIFDTGELHRLTAAQRAIVVTRLANLLMLAAGATARERDDDQR